MSQKIHLLNRFSAARENRFVKMTRAFQPWCCRLLLVEITHDTRQDMEGGAQQSRQSSPVCATTNIRKEQNKDICINREQIMSYQGKKNIPKITVSCYVYIHKYLVKHTVVFFFYLHVCNKSWSRIKSQPAVVTKRCWVKLILRNWERSHFTCFLKMRFWQESYSKCIKVPGVLNHCAALNDTLHVYFYSNLSEYCGNKQ